MSSVGSTVFSRCSLTKVIPVEFDVQSVCIDARDNEYVMAGETFTGLRLFYQGIRQLSSLQGLRFAVSTLCTFDRAAIDSLDETPGVSVKLTEEK